MPVRVSFIIFPFPVETRKGGEGGKMFSTVIRQNFPFFRRGRNMRKFRLPSMAPVPVHSFRFDVFNNAFDKHIPLFCNDVRMRENGSY